MKLALRRATGWRHTWMEMRKNTAASSASDDVLAGGGATRVRSRQGSRRPLRWQRRPPGRTEYRLRCACAEGLLCEFGFAALLSTAQMIGRRRLGAGRDLGPAWQAPRQRPKPRVRRATLVVIVPRRVIGPVLLFPRPDVAIRRWRKSSHSKCPSRERASATAKAVRSQLTVNSERAVGARRMVGCGHHAGDGEVLEARLHAAIPVRDAEFAEFAGGVVLFTRARPPSCLPPHELGEVRLAHAIGAGRPSGTTNQRIWALLFQVLISTAWRDLRPNSLRTARGSRAARARNVGSSYP